MDQSQNNKKVLQFFLYLIGAILIGLIIARFVDIPERGPSIRDQLYSAGPVITEEQAKASLEDLKAPVPKKPTAEQNENIFKALQQ